jgi:hypothetical protein
MRKHPIKVLCLLLLAALGLMVFAASAAQASGQVKILGLLNTGDVGGEPDSLYITLLVPALHFEIACDGFTVEEGSITSAGTGTGLGKILYERCLVFESLEVGKGELILGKELPCQVLDAVTGAPGHIKASVNFLVILHGPVGEKDSYLLATPDNKEGIFATIKFSGGTGCPLPLVTKVTGSTVAQVLAGDLNLGPEVINVLIESSKALSKLFPSHVLKYGANTAYVDGSAWLRLLGVHLNCEWGVL